MELICRPVLESRIKLAHSSQRKEGKKSGAFLLSGCLNPHFWYVLCSTIKFCSVHFFFFSPFSLCEERIYNDTHHHHEASYHWVVGKDVIFLSAHICLISDLLFWQMDPGSRHASPIIPLCLCWSPSLQSTLDNILRLQGELAKVKISYGDSHCPSSIWTHAYTPPLPLSLLPPHPQSSPEPLLPPPSDSGGGLKAQL